MDNKLKYLHCKNKHVDPLSIYKLIDERILLPKNPKILIDNNYIFSSIGTISKIYKEASKKLLLESINFNNKMFK